jgi:hypothetical protein
LYAKFLVIVSCGRQKIWDKHPNAGPTHARSAYTSSVFKTSRRYAEYFASRWVILSAKYGFIDPDFIIPGTYNRSFYDSDAIAIADLKAQATAARLTDFPLVGVLGSYEYWNRVARVLEESGAEVRHINGNVGFPPTFQRLIGELIESNTPFPAKAHDII